MITVPPKGDFTGGSDCYLNTHITHSMRYQVILQDATEGTALSIQKSGHTDRSESRESNKIRYRRSKRVKREKVTI